VPDTEESPEDTTFDNDDDNVPDTLTLDDDEAETLTLDDDEANVPDTLTSAVVPVVATLTIGAVVSDAAVVVVPNVVTEADKVGHIASLHPPLSLPSWIWNRCEHEGR
jgi:hypothetical protein